MTTAELLNLVFTHTLPNGTEISITACPSADDDEEPFEVALHVNGFRFDDGLFETADEARKCFDRGVKYFQDGRGDWVGPTACGDTFF